jgi:LytS/YehU family sensor histidine kinase
MSAINRFAVPWPAIWLAWAVLAVAFLPQTLVMNLNRPEPWPTWFAIGRNAAIFGVWALLTPIALRAAKQWPPFNTMLLRNGMKLAALAILLSFLHLVAMAILTALTTTQPVDPLRLLISMAVGLGATNLLMVSALFAIGIAQAQFAGRLTAEQQLSKVRLAALHQQLQPHFLFNTLNAIAELVHADPFRAEQLLLKLSALLRRSLDGGQAQLITLREELDFLDDYLAIQHALFGERLIIERDMPEETLDALLPPMLLQPIVENALRHGIGPRREGGRVSIRTRLEAGILQVAIDDDGMGARLPIRESIGLANTRERLATEYGARATMRIQTSPAAGFQVDIFLPARGS